MSNEQRILLVEDDALIALDTQDALVDAGYEVVGPAISLEDGMVLARERLDGAVLDVNLGGSYVWPIAEALRTREVPFLMLTGFGSALDVPPTLADAPRLAKPVDHSTLLKTLRSLLGLPK